MAARKYLPTVDQLQASDISIDIRPRWIEDWTGTSAQLVAEGLLPSQFVWPIGFERSDWDHGDFSFSLRRQRPEGAKGPRRDFNDVDFWWFRRDLARPYKLDYADVLVYQKRNALKEDLARQSPEGREIARRWWIAQKDDSFRGFMQTTLHGENTKLRATSAQ